MFRKFTATQNNKLHFVGYLRSMCMWMKVLDHIKSLEEWIHLPDCSLSQQLETGYRWSIKRHEGMGTILEMWEKGKARQTEPRQLEKEKHVHCAWTTVIFYFKDQTQHSNTMNSLDDPWVAVWSSKMFWYGKHLHGSVPPFHCTEVKTEARRVGTSLDLHS